jgi:pSer/pThr/pTyr-binding forkhead associated (FHA) protein
MPALTLKFKEKVIKEYRLEKGDTLTIGRKENNDVVIENLAVSGNHAKIDAVGDGFLLTDLQSKNGTFVDEQLITSHYMKHKDVIMIGKHSFVFTYDEGEKQPDNQKLADMDKTMVMDTDQHRAMLAKTSSGMDSKALNGQPIAVLSYLSGGEGEIELTKKLTKLGKASNNDIVVKGLTVGKTSATISIRPKGYYLSYVGGIAKPKINGKPEKDSVKLEEFDTIEIGSIKMQFLYKG